MVEKQCAVCGKTFQARSALGVVCRNPQCIKANDRKKRERYKINHPEKYEQNKRKQLQKRADETSASLHVDISKIVKPTFKQLWKKADYITQESMIASYWQAHREPNFSYGKYQIMKYTDLAMYDEIRRWVLIMNGIDEYGECN